MRLSPCGHAAHAAHTAYTAHTAHAAIRPIRLMRSVRPTRPLLPTRPIRPMRPIRPTRPPGPYGPCGHTAHAARTAHAAMLPIRLSILSSSLASAPSSCPTACDRAHILRMFWLLLGLLVACALCSWISPGGQLARSAARAFEGSVSLLSRGCEDDAQHGPRVAAPLARSAERRSEGARASHAPRKRITPSLPKESRRSISGAARCVASCSRKISNAITTSRCTTAGATISKT